MKLSEEELRTRQEEIADDKLTASGYKMSQDPLEIPEQPSVTKTNPHETYREIGLRGLEKARAALEAAKDQL